MAGEGIPDWLMSIFIIFIVVMIIFKVAGLDPSKMITGIRATRRVRVQDEPRDQLERLVNNHRKVAKDCKPPNLKKVVVKGDHDIPQYDYGDVYGLEPFDEGYIVYVKTNKLQWSKPHIIPRELAGDANRRHLMVETRGFSTDGAFRWTVPNSRSKLDPTESYLKAKAIFNQIFGTQNYVDAQEDGSWATSTAIMPSVTSRVAMAEIEVPGNLVEKQFYSENEVIR